ncbi:glycosyltransferase [Mariniflexile ostreae]|uniref:Glycosyltransferase n=1 Tax=Mariniflexile ostreae TaxID=1520892 RepID=A0ABV5FA08_9FLAO
MILIALFIILAYLILIGGLIYGIKKVPIFEIADRSAKIKFSIIIPFRNEAENLPELLKSVKALKYPKAFFEIIFVDDDSDDKSTRIIQEFILKEDINITVILNERHSSSPKKDAISTAIKRAKNEWVITTDADCVLAACWLDSFNQFVQKTKAKCVAAPIKYTSANNFLNRFQLLDILSLQAATIGGFGLGKPFLCNGANFAYERDLFYELDGFEGNNAIASGDDVFFLEKVYNKYPNRVHYLKCKDAIVKTKPQGTWALLLSQRIRWAAKATAFQNGFGKLTGGLVLLANTLVAVLIVFSIFNAKQVEVLLYVLIIKCIADCLLIFNAASFFNQRDVLKSFIVAFLFYPFFSLYVVLKSTTSNYNWKARTFKK